MDQGQGDTDHTTGRRRIGRRWIFRAVAALVVAPMVVFVVGLLAILDREIRAPHWIDDRLQSAGSEMMPGGSVRMGDMWLTLGRDLHLRARMQNTVLRDADGQVLARLPVAETLISPRGLLFRQEVLVQEVRLTGAQISIQRAVDGSVQVSFQSDGALAGQADNWVDLLETVDQLLDRPELEALETVIADGVIVNYSDARAGKNYTVDGGIVTLDLRGQVVSLTGAFSLLSGRPFVTTVDMSYESPKGRRAAALNLTVADGIAADLAAQVPALGWMTVVDAPINASIRATIDDDAQLGPMFASVEVKDGVIQPTPESRPIPMRLARSYLAYDPTDESVRFDRVEVDTSWGGFSATGRAYLRDWTNGWPQSFEGQFEAQNLTAAPAEVYDTPLVIDQAMADVQLRLDPFQIDVGQFGLSMGDQSISGDATVTADNSGWGISVDLQSDAIDVMSLMPFWPEDLKTGTRKWFTDNMTDLHAQDLSLSFRSDADQGVRVGGSTWVDHARFRPMPNLPWIDGVSGFVDLFDNRLSIDLASGQSASPQGGGIDITGSQMIMPNIAQFEPPAQFVMQTQSTVTAALAYLDLPQWQFLTKAGQPVTLADGRATGAFELNLPFKKGMQPNELDFGGHVDVRDLRSELIVPNKVITSAQVRVEFDPETLAIRGPVQVGAAPMDVVWSRQIGPAAPKNSQLSGVLPVNEVFLDEFNITLPDNALRGETMAEIAIDLAPDTAPQFSARSDLQGATVRIDALGWSKPASQSGTFEIAGTLGAVPDIDRISLVASGLNISGNISFVEGGGLQRADFPNLSVGWWLSGAVTLTGRGRNAPAEVSIRNGVIDLRNARLNGGSDGAPMVVNLDRLIVADGIELTNFSGQFDSRGGMSGDFSGYLNGSAPLRGRLDPVGNGTQIRLSGPDGGAVAMAMGLLKNASGDEFNMTLVPTGAEGTFDGDMSIKNLQVREAPALAELLNAVSVVGLLQQLGGQGLMFVDVIANFRLTPDHIIVANSSAAGPGLGISLDGIYTLASKEMDFQGVLSPLYLLNGIGSILTRKGEGLIGFNFTLKGTKEAQQIGVNPLSALTPGMFREIFRRPPPELSE